MTLQARSLGMYVRQFRAFDREAVADDFEVPPHWEVTTMSAIGWVAREHPSTVPGVETERERRPLEALRWPTAGSPTGHDDSICGLNRSTHVSPGVRRQRGWTRLVMGDLAGPDLCASWAKRRAASCRPLVSCTPTTSERCPEPGRHGPQPVLQVLVAPLRRAPRHRPRLAVSRQLATHSHRCRRSLMQMRHCPRLGVTGSPSWRAISKRIRDSRATMVLTHVPRARCGFTRTRSQRPDKLSADAELLHEVVYEPSVRVQAFGKFAVLRHSGIGARHPVLVEVGSTFPQCGRGSKGLKVSSSRSSAGRTRRKSDVQVA